MLKHEIIVIKDLENLTKNLMHLVSTSSAAPTIYCNIHNKKIPCTEAGIEEVKKKMEGKRFIIQSGIIEISTDSKKVTLITDTECNMKNIKKNLGFS